MGGRGRASAAPDARGGWAERRESSQEVRVVEEAEVVKPGNKRQVCSAAAGRLSCEVRMRPRAPACAEQTLRRLSEGRVEQRIAGGARARANGTRGWQHAWLTT